MPPALPVCPREPGGAPASKRRHRRAPASEGGVTVKTFLAASTETRQAGGGAPEARAQRKRAREGNGMAGSPGECAGWAVCDGWGGCRWYEDESVSALRMEFENHFEIPFFNSSFLGNASGARVYYVGVTVTVVPYYYC